MSLSLGHLVVVLLIVFVLFGSRLPKVMGDFGKGIRNLREGLHSEEEITPKTTQQEVLPPEDKK